MIYQMRRQNCDGNGFAPAGGPHQLLIVHLKALHSGIPQMDLKAGANCLPGCAKTPEQRFLRMRLASHRPIANRIVCMERDRED